MACSLVKKKDSQNNQETILLAKNNTEKSLLWGQPLTVDKFYNSEKNMLYKHAHFKANGM